MRNPKWPGDLKFRLGTTSKPKKWPPRFRISSRCSAERKRHSRPTSTPPPNRKKPALSAGFFISTPTQERRTMEQITLYYRQGSSDKVYQASIAQRDGGYVVEFAYGRR